MQASKHWTTPNVSAGNCKWNKFHTQSVAINNSAVFQEDNSIGFGKDSRTLFSKTPINGQEYWEVCSSENP
jgi:hypothetical protein